MIRLISFNILIFFITAIGLASAQENKIDSLKSVLNSSSEDTVRVNILLDLSKALFPSNPQDAIDYGKQALALSEQLHFEKGIAYSLKNIGLAYYTQSNYSEALGYWQQSLNIFKKLNDQLGVSNLLNNIGAIYFNHGDDDHAIEYYLKSLKISEQLGDKLRIATAMTNIGGVYINKSATQELALEYFSKALQLSEESGDLEAYGACSANIGEIYFIKKKYDEALRYLNSSLEAYKKTGGDIPFTLNNIGKVYASRGDIDLAIQYQNEAYNFAEKSDNKLEMAKSLLGKGNSYVIANKLQLAAGSFENAKTLASKINSKYVLKNAYEGLAKVYSKLGHFEKAFINQELLLTIRDSLYSAEKDKKIALLQLNFDLEKKQAQIDLLTKDKALSELNLQKQNIIKSSLIAGILLVAIIAVIFFRSNKVKSRINHVLKEQNIRISKADEILKKRIDEIKEINETLKHSKAELIIAKTEAEQANRAKSEFLANMSHEIRTPLNSILGFSEILLQKISDPKSSNQLKIILSSGRTLLNLINDLLDLAKIDAGKLELHPEGVNFPVLLHEIQQMFLPQTTAKGIELKVELSSSFQKQIIVDEMRLKQILVNIIGNAVKFTKEGYVKVIAGIEKNQSSPDGTLTVSIEDTGIGIDENDLKHIFESFKQATGQKSKHFGGTGLGLAITKRLIDLMKGEINVTSRVGEGSKFLVIIPDVNFFETSEQNRDNDDLSKKIRFKNSKILVVDDVEVNRELIQSYLDGHNVEIVMASNGQQAIDIAKSTKPNLILMDLRMPIMDGRTAASYLRGQKELQQIPITALTASTMANRETDKELKDNFNGFLSKPIQRDLLFAELMKYLPYEFLN